MKAQSRMNDFLLTVTTLCVVSLVQVVSAKTTYYMDKSADCGIGTYDVDRDREITIYAKDPNSPGSSQGACTMNFRAVDVDATLTLDFIVFSISACNKVTLYLSGDATGSPKSFRCGDSPDTYNTIDRSITITLHKTEITNQNYDFQLRLRAIRENQFPPPGDSNPAAVGMVIGIVGGVFGFIIIVSIIGICCFRKYRARGPTKSPYMYDSSSKTKLEENQSHMSVGYANENVHGSPMSKRKLLAPSDSSDDRSDHGSGNRSKMSNYRNNGKMNSDPPPPYSKDSAVIPSRNSYDQPKDGFEKTRKYDERGVDVSAQPRNPMLNALKSNSKFKDTFEQTEKEAEERAKRISSSSSFENLGVAPTPPDSNENLSRPKLPPVPKSPTSKTRQKTAKIGRNPRSNSFSSDELKKLEKGAEESDNDVNIKVIHDSSTGSSTEVVPIKVNEKPKKADTSHTLKPDRKGKKGGRNQSVSSALEVDEPRPSPRGGRSQSVSKIVDEDPRPSPRAPREKERVQAFEREFDDNASQNGSGRYSKRSGRKSPRSKGRSSGGKGFSHRRGRSADPYDSRPTTPTYYGSMEDLESLPPLQRTGSKNSLYASRSSLYDRRGGRRRKGSYSESVISYGTARDDISVGRHSQIYDSCSDEDDFDGYEKPLSRRDRERMYRSENDLGRRGMKEISTQTLRETATQTGPNESVVMQPKMLVKKRKRSKSLSTAGTQTTSKKSEEGKSKKKGDKDTGTETDDETRKKRKSRRTRSAGGSEGTLKGKRSKSLDLIGVDETNKPKTKPKPAPRKSTSAITGSTENLNNPSQIDNPYYPQSEGFAPNYHPQGYPMIPPPGYPGPPSQYPYPVNNAVPNYPPNNIPQQPMMNGTIHPVPRGPKKSNWEILCELTDGKHKDDPMEVGSIASSVFTNTPSNYPVYPGQTVNQPYYNNQGYYPPAPQPQYYPGHVPQQFSHYPQANMRAQSVPDFMHDLSMSTSSDDTQEKQERRQATIDSLKEQAKPSEQVMETGTPKSTRTKPQVPKQNLRTESIV